MTRDFSALDAPVSRYLMLGTRVYLTAPINHRGWYRVTATREDGCLQLAQLGAWTAPEDCQLDGPRTPPRPNQTLTELLEDR